ncbi:MAG: PAS domain S-box protein [Caulobacteraceae bacterium]
MYKRWLAVVFTALLMGFLICNFPEPADATANNKQELLLTSSYDTENKLVDRIANGIWYSATSYSLTYRDKLFPSTPIICCRISNHELPMLPAIQIKNFFKLIPIVDILTDTSDYVQWLHFSVLIILLAGILYMFKNIRKRKSVEESLLEREELLRTLINGTPDLIFFKDNDGKYIEFNDAAIEAFGFSNDNYKNKQLEELSELSSIYKNICGNCCISDEKAWDKGSVYNGVEIIEMPDGRKRIYDVIKTPVLHKDGRRKGIVGIARDITKHKEAEEKLERKEKVLRATLNATDDGILIIGNGRQVIEANDIFLRMWNIPWDIYYMGNEVALLNYAKHQLEDPEGFGQWVEYMYEAPVAENYRAVFNDGRVCTIYTSPLMDKDHMMGRVWSFRDITARVTAKKELQKSEERYRTLVELCPDAIYVSIDGRNVFTNRAGVRLLGAKGPEDIFGKRDLDFVSSGDKEALGRSIGDIVGSGDTSVFEQRLLRLDGTEVDVEAVASVVSFRGESGMMFVVRDISERKKSEELKNKIEENMKLLNEAIEYDKLKTEFFANMSHEFKTPLNIILGSLQLLELGMKEQHMDNMQEGMNKYTQIMKQNCFRLLRLLNNLIDVTKIDSGFFEMHLKNQDLVSTVRNITQSAAEYIKDKGPELTFETDMEELVLPYDINRIERAILNLLSNAIKYTNQEDCIHVSLHRDVKNAVISVRDTGIGIPDDKKIIIFERFRQVDKSFTRKCEGSGIGLSLVKSIVEMHGGTIEVASEYGKGSEFIIKLPIRINENEETSLAVEEMAVSYEEKVNIEFSDIYL